ncbi:MAG: hypothetical protein HC802_11770, partial [Caldilineaceae bacterium]|nr:hypothetical protein [Caldilineaceae bacterium]
TGVELWRTYFDNGNVSGNWIAATNLNILPDGNIIHGWGDNVALVQGGTGLIMKTNKLPSGARRRTALTSNMSRSRPMARSS